MSAMAFDTLNFSKSLKAGGFSNEQAETAPEAISETLSDQLVAQAVFEQTKRDVEARFDRIKARLDRVETQIAELKEMIAAQELRILTRVAAMLAAAVTILVAVDKLL